jgi:hypothetical protein
MLAQSPTSTFQDGALRTIGVDLEQRNVIDVTRSKELVYGRDPRDHPLVRCETAIETWERSQPHPTAKVLRHLFLGPERRTDDLDIVDLVECHLLSNPPAGQWRGIHADDAARWANCRAHRQRDDAAISADVNPDLPRPEYEVDQPFEVLFVALPEKDGGFRRIVKSHERLH